MSDHDQLKEYLSLWAERIDGALTELLPAETEKPSVIHQSMRYSALGGGKRLRGVLALTACDAVGGEPTRALPLAAALEMIHTYSLVHDDLPALDNDTLRRGKPTNHIRFGEAIAILAGDALLTHAFIVMSRLSELTDVTAEVVLAIIREVADASGTAGLIGGQVADLQAEGAQSPLSAEQLRWIHARKTGALFRTSVRAGAILGGADEAALAALTRYAEALGLAFQIADDVLDVAGDQKTLGKRVGSDEERGKTTYPTLFGVERSRQMAAEAAASAQAALAPFGEKAKMLHLLADFAVERDH